MPEYIWGFAGYFEVWSNTMMIYIFIVSTLWFIFEFLSYCYTLFLHSALFSVLNLTFRAQQWDFSVFWCNTLLWNFTVGQWMWDVHRDSLLLFHWKQKLTNWNLEFLIKNTFFLAGHWLWDVHRDSVLLFHWNEFRKSSGNLFCQGKKLSLFPCSNDISFLKIIST